MSGTKFTTTCTRDGERMSMSFEMVGLENLPITSDGVTTVQIRLTLNNCDRLRVLHDDEFIRIAKRVDFRDILRSVLNTAIENLNVKYLDRTLGEEESTL